MCSWIATLLFLSGNIYNSPLIYGLLGFTLMYLRMGFPYLSCCSFFRHLQSEVFLFNLGKLSAIISSNIFPLPYFFFLLALPFSRCCHFYCFPTYLLLLIFTIFSISLFFLASFRMNSTIWLSRLLVYLSRDT